MHDGKPANIMKLAKIAPPKSWPNGNEFSTGYRSKLPLLNLLSIGYKTISIIGS